MSASPAGAVVSNHLYVSPSGSGTACTQAAPCSVVQAQTSVRGLTATASGDIVVHVGSGTYPLSSTWSFTSADSGRDSTHVVRWEAAAGATPLFTGAKPVTGWTEVGSTGVWKATAPSGVTDSRQLYVDGERMPRARGMQAPTGFTQTATGYTTTTAASMGAYKNPAGVEFVYREAWTWSRCGVESVAGTAITMAEPCWTNRLLAWGYGPGSIQYVENAFELLDQPGESYFDTSGDVAGSGGAAVYYKPRAGEALTGTSAVTVTVPAVQTLLSVSGEGTSARVHHLQFVGLTFADSSWLAPSGDEGFIDTQTNMTWVGLSPAKSVDGHTKVPAAVEFNYANDIVVQGNTLTRIGSVGLDVAKSSNNVEVIGNHVYDTSGNGINIGGIKREDQHPGAFDYTEHSTTVDGAYFTASFTGRRIDYLASASTGTGTADIYIDNVLVDSVDCSAIGDRYQQVCGSVGGLTNTSHTIKVVKTGGAKLNLDVLRAHPSGLQTDDANAAITYGGTWTAATGLNFPADRVHDITVQDNYVHNVANEFLSGGGIWVGLGDTVKLLHNEVADVPYSGITVGWGWGIFDPTIAANNETVGNYVHHFMLAGHDGGASYTLGSQPNSVEHDNYYAQSPDIGNLYAIYKDNGSQHFTITSNVVDRVSNWRFISDNYSAPYALNNTLTGNWANTTGKNGCTNSSNVCTPNDDTIVGQAWPAGAQAVIASAGLETSGTDYFGATRNWKTELHAAGSTTNLALGAGVTAAASSEYSASYSAAKAIDDNTVTRWSASGGTSANLTVTFPSATSIDRLVWREAKHCCGGRIQDYKIEYWDGTLWKTVKSGSFPGLSQTDRFSEISTTKIRLNITNTSPGATISEFEVYHDNVDNLALNRPATQSSTYTQGLGGAASRGVDGNTDGNYWNGSVTHTNCGVKDWWQVDLGSVQGVGDIEVYNRTDGFGSRLSDYWVFVSQHPFDTTLTPTAQAATPGVWSNHQTTQAGSPTTVSADVAGRYVMVQQAGTNCLHMAEVKVLPEETLVITPPFNYAEGQTATQSSTYAAGGAASRGVDGNTDGVWWNGSVTHTNVDVNAWWQVDLGGAKSIGNIEVWNRTDGFPERLSDYWVFVSTTPFNTALSPTDQATASGVVWSSHQTTQAGSPTVLPANVTGRYVMVQLAGTNALHMAEVKVFNP